LQGASGPLLPVLPRNPSPWHCEQDSFATAMVFERFQSKFTNIPSPGTNHLHRIKLNLISHYFRNIYLNWPVIAHSEMPELVKDEYVAILS
jgi:hypothetical protein